MVRNVPFIAGDMSLISGQVTKIPHAEKYWVHALQNLCTKAGESVHHKERSHMLQRRPNAAK